MPQSLVQICQNENEMENSAKRTSCNCNFFYAKREKPLDVTITIFCQNPGRDRDGITYRYLFVMKKVFNWSELHLSEVTSYKIHILVTILNRRTDLFFYHDHYEVANVTTFLVTFFDW